MQIKINLFSQYHIALFIISFDKNNDILIQSFVIFLIGVILLMIAAYIEVYITKDLANYLIQTYHIK